MVDDDGRIAGTLAYIDDYTGFSPDLDFQGTHFLALRIDGGNPGAGVVVDLIGETNHQDAKCIYVENVEDERYEAILDNEGEVIEGTRLGNTIMVFRITDKDSQMIHVVVSMDGEEPIEVNADATAEEPKEVNPAKSALLETIEKFSTKESPNEEH